jgi:hypothetical protein
MSPQVGIQCLLVTQNKPPIRVVLQGSLSGDKVEPVIYSATTERLRRTAVPCTSIAPPGSSSSATGNDLNRQELDRLYGPPPHPPR